MVYRVVPRGEIAMAVVRILLSLCLAVSGAVAVAIAFRMALEAIGFALAGNVAAVFCLGLALLDRTIRTYAEDFLTEPLALLWTTLFVAVAVTIPRNTDSRGRVFVMAVLWAAWSLPDPFTSFGCLEF